MFSLELDASGFIDLRIAKLRWFANSKLNIIQLAKLSLFVVVHNNDGYTELHLHYNQKEFFGLIVDHPCSYSNSSYFPVITVNNK